jgi:hypothetical protein
MEKPIPTDIEITCPCQRDIKVSAKWCDTVQFQQLCGPCPHNEGRMRSKYQQKKDRVRAKDFSPQQGKQ